MAISRLGVTHALNAADIAAIRFFVSGLILLPWWMKNITWFGPKGLGGIILAICLGAPYTFIAVSGMHYATVAHAGMIYGISACLTCLMGMWLLGEYSTPVKLAGLVITMLGALALMSKGSTHAELSLGHFLFIVAGGLLSLYAILVKKWKVPAFTAAANVCVWSLLLYLPVYVMFLPKQIMTASSSELCLQVVYQGVITSIGGLIFFNRGVAILGASQASAFMPLVPALATLISIPLLGEVPSSVEWLGICLISVGILLASGVVRFGCKKWVNV